MNFAEKLKYKADMFELDLNVHKEISSIEKKMEEHFDKREYTIELIKAKTAMAIGGTCTNFSHFFVPYSVSPAHYRQLFIDELFKLGFKGTDIELDEFDCRSYTSYKIIVRW
jgi:hypothetical protein